MFDCSWYRTDPNKQFKRTGTFFDDNIQEFLFSPPKNYKPNKQTTWNTNHLHSIAWSCRKFEYDKLFDVFHDINTMNAEVFVKSLEISKLVLRLLVRNVEKVDDYGCPKVQDIIVAEEGNISLISSSYPFRRKSRLHSAQKKANVLGEWAMQHLMW